MATFNDDAPMLRALAIFRRRRVVALAVFAVVLAAAASFATFLPDLYRATAIVLIDRPVAEAYVRPAVAGELDSRLHVIKQETLSRERLSSLIERFANPALAHRTAQIAMDGSQKLPQRLLGTVRDQLGAGGSIRLLSLAIAGWMRYAAGTDERGRPIEVADPLAARFRAIAGRAGNDPAALVHGFLEVREVFADDLPREQRFRAEVTDWLRALVVHGARASVERAASG